MRLDDYKWSSTPLFIASQGRFLEGGGTYRELRRSVGRSVASTSLLGSWPMLGCTDLVNQWCGCTLLDWASLARLTRTPMWSNVVNKASHGLLGECGGPWPSFGAFGHKSRSLNALGGQPSICVQPSPTRLAIFRKHNFVIQTLNRLKQNSVSCISTRSSTWCSKNRHLRKCFYHVYDYLVPTLT